MACAPDPCTTAAVASYDAGRLRAISAALTALLPSRADDGQRAAVP